MSDNSMPVSNENLPVQPIQPEQPKREFLSDSDNRILDMVKMKKALAHSQAETADLLYNNVVLQLTIKYSLTEKDSLTDAGEILRNSKK